MKNWGLVIRERTRVTPLLWIFIYKKLRKVLALKRFHITSPTLFDYNGYVLCPKFITTVLIFSFVK